LGRFLIAAQMRAKLVAASGRQAADEMFPNAGKSLRSTFPKMHPATGTADQLAGFPFSKF
jgi:hypothetical protein